MATSTNAIRVYQAGTEQADDVAEVLTEAFLDYPMMRFFFPPGTKGVRKRLRALFGLTGWYRLQTDQPLLAAEIEGRIVGAAGLVAPDSLPDPEDMDVVAEDAFAIIGTHAADRMEEYSHMKDSHARQEPHYYLAMIGVVPEMQGKGVGRALLDRTGQISREDPISTGVGLDTQSPANVAYYRKFGYQVVAEDTLDDVPMWFMFRPDDA